MWWKLPSCGKSPPNTTTTNAPRSKTQVLQNTKHTFNINTGTTTKRNSGEIKLTWTWGERERGEKKKERERGGGGEGGGGGGGRCVRGRHQHGSRPRNIAARAGNRRDPYRTSGQRPAASPHLQNQAERSVVDSRVRAPSSWAHGRHRV